MFKKPEFLSSRTLKFSLKEMSEMELCGGEFVSEE